MSEPTIRSATIADVPALHALVEGAYRGDSARGGWTHEADLLGGQRTDPAALAAILADADHRILLACVGIDPVGCVQIGRGDGTTATLGLLAVAPGRQAGGLGRRLIAAAEAEAATRFGARRMEMTVIVQRDELIAWYERRGYVPTGETRPFPLDDPRFGLPVRRDLAFTVLAKALS
ncbi:GNAT family N-acetyltransferase [Sphingomonas solaris]|uniref:GNAT family N-acetyltransferase n=1 Tax=Alterirhizorhabdus solaris TaxID=2529389 RepID=A0A558QSG9_9SPHN|nr:GNAT family N-acetyltransferase [Sphingomonas solaris]TVV70091.1 GNAT family N-acetyltransferase [Sphingomonas solaris]